MILSLSFICPLLADSMEGWISFFVISSENFLNSSRPPEQVLNSSDMPRRYPESVNDTVLVMLSRFHEPCFQCSTILEHRVHATRYRVLASSLCASDADR